jgi:hypothetical protein
MKLSLGRMGNRFEKGKEESQKSAEELAITKLFN